MDSIHAASFKVWNTWKYKMRSVRGQTSLERSAFSLPPHMNEPILTVAAERTSQLLPNHRFYDPISRHNISFFSHPYHIDSLRTNKRNLRTNKRNFHHMFRITRLVSLARHTHEDHHFVRKGLFSKGEYPRHLGVPTPPKQEV